MARLWKRFRGEPFLINPHLISLNPRRKKMAKRRTKRRMPRRGARGRFVASGTFQRNRTARRRRRSYASPVRRRRRTYRRNAYFMNPRRRRSRRSYRRNPAFISSGGLMGIRFTDIAYAGLGFVAPPAINGFISGMLPAALTGNPLGRYAVKGGIVFGLSWAGSKFISREAGKYIAIGGITYIVANLIIDFVPQLFSGFSGYMSPGPAFRTLPRRTMGAGPYLGMYQAAGTNPVKLPERVDPNARF